jgi:hypothetical protein
LTLTFLAIIFHLAAYARDVKKSGMFNGIAADASVRGYT